MYHEFIAIYVGLALLAALMITVLVLLIKLTKQAGAKPISKPYIPQMNNSTDAPTKVATGI